MTGRLLIGLAAAFIATGLAATAVLLWRGGGPRADSPTRRPKPGAAAEAAPASAYPPPSDTEAAPPESARPADFKRLEGRWVRQDGDYTLELRRVTEEGRIEAGYTNPQRPIHVARAEATTKGTALEVFVELRDEGYPGCTYRLTYRRERDQLEGTYFQAAQGASYDVVFDRMK